MRTFTINKLGVTATIVTNDLITPAFGKIFIDVTISSSSSVKPHTINVANFDNDIFIAHPVIKNKCRISLEWLKYLAPKSGTANIYIDLCINNDVEIDKSICGIEFELTAGYGEVQIGIGNIAKELNRPLNSWFKVCPTQITRHPQHVEALLLIEPDRGEELGYHSYNDTAFDENLLELGFNETFLPDQWGLAIGYINQGNESIVLWRKMWQDRTCADIELRITNRDGLRGILGGMVADVSEGGDDEKTNISSNYRGVYKWDKKGATIKKEVTFNFEGDADLLDLLRDACVYGQVEWYCEASSEWLPCKVDDNSLATNDPYEEQTITITLQEL